MSAIKEIRTYRPVILPGHEACMRFQVGDTRWKASTATRDVDGYIVTVTTHVGDVIAKHIPFANVLDATLDSTPTPAKK